MTGLAATKRGAAATVRQGPYVDDKLCADHVIRRAVPPKLDNCTANLESMPLRMDEGKKAQIGSCPGWPGTENYTLLCAVD